jgi:hypothetical protein
MIKIIGDFKMPIIERTPKKVEEVKKQIQWQTKMGYLEGVKINQHWLATGEHMPIYGVPPTFNSAIDIDTPICRGFSSKTGEVRYLNQEAAE